VAGATRMAAGMRDLGAPGLAYWLRTGLPVWSAMAAASTNRLQGSGGCRPPADWGQ